MGCAWIRVLLISTLFSSFTSAENASPASPWQPDVFPIGYWYGPPASYTTLDRYKQIKDAGFTIVMPPGGDMKAPGAGMSAEINHKILSYCQQLGMKAIIFDPRRVLKIGNDSAAKDALDAIVKEYKDEPAFAGYYLKDEPKEPMFAGLSEVAAYLRQRDPKHIVYVNLLPNGTPNVLGDSSYQKYLDDFISQYKPEIISYDCYHFTSSGDRPIFLPNLGIIRKTTLDHSLPFWNIVLCTQHLTYRNLTEAELRYEAMMTLVYGGKGLIWFTYWSPARTDKTTTWTHPIVNDDGSLDPHYEMVKHVNAELGAIGTELLHAESLDVRHTKDSPVTEGFFRATDGQPMLMIVNNDYQKEIDQTIAVPKDHVERFDPKQKTWSPVDTADGLTLKLSPAQGVLVRYPNPTVELKNVAQSQVDSRGMTLDTNAPYGAAINGQAFQFDAITSFRGYQYAVYWVRDDSQKAKYFIAVARRNLKESTWEVINLPDSPYRNGLDKKGVPIDAHNTPSIGICPADGTIHLSYDMHGHQLNYRVSEIGAATTPESTKWEPSLFHPRQNHLGDTKPLESVTYPMFVRTPDGNMQLFYRIGGSGIGDNWAWDYDGITHKWTGGRQFDTRVGDFPPGTKSDPKKPQTRNNYPNGYNYDSNGRLYTSFVWRESRPYGDGSNHDINFAYSDDRGVTWKNNAGQAISNTNGDHGLPKCFDVTTPGLIVQPLSQYNSLMNTQAQAMDSQNELHVFMWHLDPDAAYRSVWDNEHSSYFHYWRDSDGAWHRTQVRQSDGGGWPGSRPRLVIDKNDDLLAVYTVRTGESIGKNSIYFPQGKLIIAEATKVGGWADWKIVASEAGPFVNEPLIDYQRFAETGVLSVMMQTTPTENLQATKINVFDFAPPAPPAVGSAGETNSQARIAQEPSK